METQHVAALRTPHCVSEELNAERQWRPDNGLFNRCLGANVSEELNAERQWRRNSDLTLRNDTVLMSVKS